MRTSGFLRLFGIGAMVLATSWLAACGGDDDDDTAGSGNVAKAGTSAASTENAGTGGSNPSADAIRQLLGDGGWRFGDGGFRIPDGGFRFPDGGGMRAQCSETAPTAPVTCGGATCTTSDELMQSCVYPCCTKKGDTEVCGGRYASAQNPVECQPYPPVADTRCPDVTAAGTVLKGCCNPANQCGIISSVRNLCVTKSQTVTLPETPKACDAQ